MLADTDVYCDTCTLMGRITMKLKSSFDLKRIVAWRTTVLKRE
jgi:hypothetical protein